MIGSIDDMIRRLKMVLPARWFADNTPILDGVLTGLGSTSTWAYELLGAVRQQARIATASGTFLDIAAADFFGSRVVRGAGQSDQTFRVAILREIFRPRATREALSEGVQDATGRLPDIFEPSRPADTGIWNHFGGYGVAGRWGSLRMPNQILLVAYRPFPGAPEAAELSDFDILSAAADVAPIATTVWVRIES